MKAGEMTLLNGSGATTSSLPLSFSCTNIYVFQDYYSYYIIYNYYKILFRSKEKYKDQSYIRMLHTIYPSPIFVCVQFNNGLLIRKIFL